MTQKIKEEELTEMDKAFIEALEKRNIGQLIRIMKEHERNLEIIYLVLRKKHAVRLGWKG